MNENLQSWYEWRWNQVFASDDRSEPPVLSPHLRQIFPIRVGDYDRQLSTERIVESLGWDRVVQYPIEVVRLYAVAGGSLEVPNRSLLDTINHTIVSLRRCESIHVTDSNSQPFWGSLPEADYLSNLRTTFLNQYSPCARLDHIIDYYDQAIRVVNRLQLSKGSTPKVPLILAE